MRSQGSLSLGWEEKPAGTLKQKGCKESSKALTELFPPESLIKMKAECLKFLVQSSPITQGKETPKRDAGPAAARRTHSLYPLIHCRNNPAHVFLLATQVGWLPCCFQVCSYAK